MVGGCYHWQPCTALLLHYQYHHTKPPLANMLGFQPGTWHLDRRWAHSDSLRSLVVQLSAVRDTFRTSTTTQQCGVLYYLCLSHLVRVVWYTASSSVYLKPCAPNTKQIANTTVVAIFCMACIVLPRLVAMCSYLLPSSAPCRLLLRLCSGMRRDRSMGYADTTNDTTPAYIHI